MEKTRDNLVVGDGTEKRYSVSRPSLGINAQSNSLEFSPDEDDTRESNFISIHKSQNVDDYLQMGSTPIEFLILLKFHNIQAEYIARPALKRSESNSL